MEPENREAKSGPSKHARHVLACGLRAASATVSTRDLAGLPNRHRAPLGMERLAANADEALEPAKPPPPAYPPSLPPSLPLGSLRPRGLRPEK